MMMKLYADYDYYTTVYAGAKLSDEYEAERCLMQATSVIRNLTFGRIEEMQEVPEDAKMCCCEVAERLYAADSAKTENGVILQSYSNDGESGTYAVADISESATDKAVYNIVHRWLSLSGLMYCGVMR